MDVDVSPDDWDDNASFKCRSIVEPSGPLSSPPATHPFPSSFLPAKNFLLIFLKSLKHQEITQNQLQLFHVLVIILLRDANSLHNGKILNVENKYEASEQ
ncbi:hypothetical protein P9112_014267 [Eukaryota sp. TZLM1-RC]